jgi:light-regulated signal transduction histidine kinase (bacteriophytochrome)
MEQIDLAGIAAKAVLNLQSMIQESGATVMWDTLPTVLGHPGPFLTLFQNLIGNAIKYHRDNEAPRVNIQAERRVGEWLVTVEDNGIGIEPEYRERVFGVFKRLNPSKYPGTGIGLALCARVVESRGGTIWVESEPGQGSRFCLTIPDR